MRTLTTCVYCLICATVSDLQGAVIVTARETNSGVTFVGRGTLSPMSVFTPVDFPSPGFVSPDLSLQFGDTTAVPYYKFYVVGSGPLTIGNNATGMQPITNATSGLGDVFGIAFSRKNDRGLIVLYIPNPYTPGDELSGEMTFEDATFESLGIELGTYIWTWDDSFKIDTFTLNIVPEPSTATLILFCVVTTVARRRRQLVPCWH